MSFPGTPRAKLLKRGDIRLLVLERLKAHPLHGYELAKEIAVLSGGFYEPSPGVVYPTLQRLEDEECVRSSPDGSKKVYRVTEKGTTLLEEGRCSLERVMGMLSAAGKGERMELMRAGARLARVLSVLSEEVTEEKARRARLILEEARARVTELVAE